MRTSGYVQTNLLVQAVDIIRPVGMELYQLQI